MITSRITTRVKTKLHKTYNSWRNQVRKENLSEKSTTALAKTNETTVLVEINQRMKSLAKTTRENEGNSRTQRKTKLTSFRGTIP